VTDGSPTPNPNRFATSAAARRRRRNEWRNEHQPFELEFHRGDNFRWHDEPFMHQWDLVFGELCGLAPDGFEAGDVLLDLGCGSRPALDWFDETPRKVHLDPLLERYREIPEVARFWQGERPEDCIAGPAEDLVPALEGRCQFVLCWNVLDHTFDWREILQNVWRYVTPGGITCIGTDIEPNGPGHPGIEDPHAFGSFLASRFEILGRQQDFLGRELALVLRKPRL
jgi:SAM-dependent methyltransferase